MSFPEWGHSYNALYVPLSGGFGWQCTLMTRHEFEQIKRHWSTAYACRDMSLRERRDVEKEWDEQIEQDRQDFNRFFRVSIDRRDAYLSTEFRQYLDFIRHELRVSSWDVPVDGEGITRMLRRAVRDGRLVPAVNRERYWRSGREVFKRYAPQFWPRGGGGVSFATSSGGAKAPTGRFTGPFAAAMHAADTVMNSRLASSSRAIRRGFDWLGAAESVAGAAFGGADTAEINGGDSMLKSFGDSGSGGALLADAEPFEYQPDISAGDGFDVAGIPNMTGDPNSWIENGPGMKKQWRMFGPDGSAAVDIDFDSHHGQPNPHAHNWDGTARDQGWPVSIFPR